MTTATSTRREQTVEVAGRKIRLEQDGTGSPLLLLHHSTGNPGWVPFYELLARSFEVFVPDLPGYGQSERPEWAREPRDLAILIGHLIEKLNLGPVTLVGLGLGGFIAAELAAIAPRRLASLVLVGAAGLKPSSGEILDQMLIDYVEYVQAGFRDEQHYQTALGEHAKEQYRQLWDFSREMTARLTWKPYMFSRRLEPLLAEVETPALLIWGSDDKVVPPACGQQYARALPHATLELIEGAGHLVELEEPERVAALIVAHASGA